MKDNQIVDPEPHKPRRVPLWLIGIFVLFPVIATIPMFITTLHTRKLEKYRMGWEAKARESIMVKREEKLKSMDINAAGTYGSWKDLVENGYIDEVYADEEIIENYTLWTYIPEPDYLLMLDDIIMEVDVFTVVAFPRPMVSPEYLMTFAIREDGILREYYPDTPGVKAWGEDGDLGARTWEPIR